MVAVFQTFAEFLAYNANYIIKFPKRVVNLEEVDNVGEWNLQSDIDLAASEEEETLKISSNGGRLPKAKRDIKKKGWRNLRKNAREANGVGKWANGQ
ncbi:hypothetical protein CDAR_316421 [Caerostris darwini]|uniref:Uncharacterized protein n=1 Tax=Caerostris darwini TaxID=1538125 RepID=A0AAV4ULB6_9ARAC|nr:hypothetical protein CDAR_316421 [Caerostris darwini]